MLLHFPIFFRFHLSVSLVSGINFLLAFAFFFFSLSLSLVRFFAFAFVCCFCHFSHLPMISGHVREAGKCVGDVSFVI